MNVAANRSNWDLHVTSLNISTRRRVEAVKVFHGQKLTGDVHLVDLDMYVISSTIRSVRDDKRHTMLIVLGTNWRRASSSSGDTT